MAYFLIHRKENTVLSNHHVVNVKSSFDMSVEGAGRSDITFY
jgi:hypothetical protein